MARPTMPDNALVGDPGHATDHNLLRDGIAELFLERQTGDVDPEGVVTGPPGMFYVNKVNAKLWVKITGTGNTGWGNGSAGASDHAQLSGLTNGDPHTQYQQESERNVANGYAGLDANAQVPVANQAVQVPIGAIIAFGGTSAPAGWLLCNGAAINGAYTALIALVGTTTPNLLDRFIVGAGSTYASKATGGLATVTLSSAESGLRDHGHTAGSGGEGQEHTHTFGSGYMNQNNVHGHGIPQIPYGPYNGVNQDGDISFRSSITKYTSLMPVGATGVDINHTHSGTTDGRSAVHTHAISVSASGAWAGAAAHENRPPYYALTYIIRAI